MNKAAKPILAAALLLGLVVPAIAPAQATRHAADVWLRPGNGEITIRDEVEFHGRDEFRFYLAPWLVLERLSVDGAEWQPDRRGRQWVVRLPGNAVHRLEFELKGRVPARDEAGEGLPSSTGADGGFLPGHEAWLPWDGVESIDYRLRVRVPAGQRAVATGKLVSERTGAEHYTAEFESSHAGEPPSLFAGPYEVQERVVDGVRFRTYFHAELDGFAERYLEASAGYVARYRQKIGAYPYADFHVVSAPLPVGLGFPNLTYVGRRVLPLPFMLTRSLAHEVLHNWWGNGVAIDYPSGNWAEGLTTFMADYALEQDKGPAAARSMRIKWLRDYAALPAERDRPVRAFVSKQHQAAQVIGYNKVAFIFHMLTLEIGQAAFDAGLQRFWQRHRFTAAGWDDLQAAFEDSAGIDLDWFFTQWLDRRGAPRISLGTHDVEPVDGGFRVSVEVIQPVSGYRLRLPVELGVGGKAERHEIVVEDGLTRLEWTTDAPPDYVHFDPGGDVFRLLGRAETPPILRDITLDPATVIVVGSDDADFDAAARSLAARLMDVAPDFSTPERLGEIDRPLMLITTRDRAEQQLARLNVRTPAQLASTAHSASAWTARRDNGAPLLVVSADDATGLRALQRPLPHYGGQSYVLFDAARAIERGIWPLARGALYRELR